MKKKLNIGFEAHECNDANCTEKLFLQKAFMEAIAKGDFNSHMKPDSQEKYLEPICVVPALTKHDWDKLFVQDRQTGRVFSSSVLPKIDEQYVHNTKTVEQFKSWKDINKSFSKVPNVTLLLSDNYGLWREKSINGFTLQKLYVSPKLRGQGIGSHVMRTLVTHADENDLSIELEPTDKGDGRLEEGQDGWVEAAIDHRKRLVKFYGSFGFKLNPFYHYPYRSDYLTKKPHGINKKARAKFTRKGEKILRSHSEYIRFPNGKYPEGWIN